MVSYRYKFFHMPLQPAQLSCDHSDHLTTTWWEQNEISNLNDNGKIVRGMGPRDSIHYNDAVLRVWESPF